jgi:hypothetical protein
MTEERSNQIGCFVLIGFAAFCAVMVVVHNIDEAGIFKSEEQNLVRRYLRLRSSLKAWEQWHANEAFNRVTAAEAL